MQNVIELSKNFVIQRSVLATAKQVELTELMNNVAGSGKHMIVVDNLTEFFNINNLLNAVNKGDTNTLIVVAEKNEIDIESADLDLIYAFNRFKTKLIEKANEKLPAYTFAEVPEGWSVANKLKINAQSVARKNDTNYSIGLKTLEKIWLAASKVWNGEIDVPQRVNSVNASGYNRDVTIKPNTVDIGCQSIHRHELEQVALHMGWAFPEKAKY